MLNTLGIVQGCFCTGHCRGMVNRRILGQPLLEWVVRRVTDCMRLDGVIVVACDADEHRAIRDLVPLDVPVFIGKEQDPLGRFARAIKEYPAKAVVRVRGDNPLVDPALIDRLVTKAESHGKCDYASYCLSDGRPAILSPVGMYAEWFRATALRRAARAAASPGDREHVTQHIYSHPERFQLRLIPAPAELDRDDFRLTVHGAEDAENVQSIVDALGPESLEWQRIAGLLDHQPAMRKRMAALNRAACAR